MSDAEVIYRQIVENSQDAILIADRNGVIDLWNTGAEAIFGYTKEEAHGKSLDLIIPEKLRERHWQGYHTVMKTGETRYGKELLKVPAIRKDGKSISIEFTIMPIKDPSNQIMGIAAIIRDVTERWMQEKEMKQKIKVLESKLVSQSPG
ncbi:MAG: PAS domain S-box protein [Desulfobacterales bacterium]